MSSSGAAGFYQGFSFEVGVRDWLVPNLRHEQLDLIVTELLDGAHDLRILDIGCGAGVLAKRLARFGRVTGLDFSEPAIELARDLVPEAEFHAGGLEDVELEGTFDLVTLFDVLEHVPPGERTPFLERVAGLLGPTGLLFASTPHPVHLRWLREEHPDVLQVVDEPVGVGELLGILEPLGLELLHYRTFDVDRGPREYQAFAFGRVGPPGGAPSRHRLLTRRLVTRANPVSRRLRRATVARRLGRARGPAWRRWALHGRGEPPA